MWRAITQVATLRDEIQQIVASATLPLHARLSELQNKIHDWLKNTETYLERIVAQEGGG